jgi:hypothetical protein
MSSATIDIVVHVVTRKQMDLNFFDCRLEQIPISWNVLRVSNYNAALTIRQAQVTSLVRT